MKHVFQKFSSRAFCRHVASSHMLTTLSSTRNLFSSGTVVRADVGQHTLIPLPAPPALPISPPYHVRVPSVHGDAPCHTLPLVQALLQWRRVLLAGCVVSTSASGKPMSSVCDRWPFAREHIGDATKMSGNGITTHLRPQLTPFFRRDLRLLLTSLHTYSDRNRCSSSDARSEG